MVVTFRAAAVATAPAGWLDTTNDITIAGTFYAQGADIQAANGSNAAAGMFTITAAAQTELQDAWPAIARGDYVVING